MGNRDRESIRIANRVPENRWYRYRAQVELVDQKVYLAVVHRKTSGTGFVAIDDVYIDGNQCPHDALEKQIDLWVAPDFAIQYEEPNADEIKRVPVTAGFLVIPKELKGVDYWQWQMIGTQNLMHFTKMQAPHRQTKMCISFQYLNRAVDSTSVALLVGLDDQKAIEFKKRVHLPPSTDLTWIQMEIDLSADRQFVPYILAESDHEMLAEEFFILDMDIDFGKCQVENGFFCADTASTYIAYKKRCNFIQDCPNNADESKCGQCSFESTDDDCGYTQESDNARMTAQVVRDDDETRIDLEQLERPTSNFLLVQDQSDGKSANHFDWIGPEVRPPNRMCEMRFSYASHLMDVSVKLRLEYSSPIQVWDSSYSPPNQDQSRLQNVSIPLGNNYDFTIFRFHFTSSRQAVDRVRAKALISSVEMVDCAPLEERECSSDEFKCVQGGCIPGWAVCNLVSECADGSDEKDCPATAYRLDFERRNQFEPHLRDDSFVSTHGSLTPSADMPRLDHTFITMGGNYAYMGAAFASTTDQRRGKLTDVSLKNVEDRLEDQRPSTSTSDQCKGRLTNFRLNNYGSCQLRLFAASNATNRRVNLVLHATKVHNFRLGSHLQKSYALNALETHRWNRYVLDLNELQVWGQFRMQVDFLLDRCQDWLAIDDLSFSSGCYPQFSEATSCFFQNSAKPFCEWRLKPPISQNSNKFSWCVGHTCDQLGQLGHRLPDNCIPNLLLMFDQADISWDDDDQQKHMQLQSPPTVLSKPDSNYLRVEMTIQGPEVGQVSIYQDSLDTADEEHEKRTRVLLLRQRKQTLARWTLFQVPFKAHFDQFRLTIEARGFGRHSVIGLRYVFLTTEGRLDRGIDCTFEDTEKVCKAFSLFPTVNHFELIDSGSAHHHMSDHTLDSPAGGYLLARPMANRFRHSLLLRNIRRNRWHRLSFWMTTWHESGKYVGSSCPAYKFALDNFHSPNLNRRTTRLQPGKRLPATKLEPNFGQRSGTRNTRTIWRPFVQRSACLARPVEIDSTRAQLQLPSADNDQRPV